MNRHLRRVCLTAGLPLLLVAVGTALPEGGSRAVAELRAAPKATTSAELPRITSVSVSLSRREVRPGGRSRLLIEVRNDGEAPVSNIEVRLKSSNPRVDLNVSSWRLDRLEPGSTASRSVAVLLDRRAGGRAWLTAAASGRSDSVPLTVIDLGPCRNPLIAEKLLCPDFKVAEPSEMYADYRTRPGRVLLRSTNDIQSRGSGPMELRGRRDRPRTMAVIQAIARRGGGYALYPVQARLGFHNVGEEYGGSYWKVRSPLRFELWSLDSRGEPARRVRVGPKQFYCFRDLVRTDPGPRSPSPVVYPACNQNPSQREVTLGTSVGWSDIYPSTYDEQWIDVTGLKGCFVYLLRVDPLELLYESREGNNVSQRKVKLPFSNRGVRGC